MLSLSLTEQIKPLDAEVGAMLVEAAGAPDFSQLLLDAASHISNVDEIFGYLVADGEDPQQIVSASTLPGSRERVSQYLLRFYHHDPAVHELQKIDTASNFVQRIGNDAIIPYDYRELCFREPNFAEKLSFGWRGNGFMIVLSFYRREKRDDTALLELASLANLTLAIMVSRHAPFSPDQFIERLERRIARNFPKLTRRETQVSARTLAGWTSKKTGIDLGIGSGSVLTYRQRAYQKLGFSNATDFLPFVLN